MVKPKKHLGQHFLTDLVIAEKIVEALEVDSSSSVLEIGPGEGVLTDFLMAKKNIELTLIEIDPESIFHLNLNYINRDVKIIEGDFLKMDLDDIFAEKSLKIIGNFPYNISSQIMFKVFENRDQVIGLVGMFQKEVAKRIAAPPGSKTYGILSVLIQAYYSVEYILDVPPEVFNPPPKVHSGVIKLQRNDRSKLPMSDNDFKKIVKMAFGQRRKTLRNSLRGALGDKVLPEKFTMQRPEQLSVDDFLELAIFLKD
ncbi:MAG: 16S rRNA (adenine1518-N6/adenine1519-N6)-dimethyltransferase [Patiriisocius sp.]|jgi:16S rRNA (adenine1518-N6/adenine1519-N6)-dimethyltransferase